MAVHEGGYRVGDPEREEALRQLREHAAQGRLTAEEFDERVGAVLRARTREDLVQPFADLPPLDEHLPAVAAPDAGPPAPPQAAADPGQVAKASRRGWDWRAGLTAAAWPATLLACFATDWRYWWLLLVPSVITTFLLPGQSGDADEEEDSAEEAGEAEPPASRSGPGRRN